MRFRIMHNMIQTSPLVPGDTKLLWCRMQGCHIRKVRHSGSVIILWFFSSKISDFLCRDRITGRSSVKCLCPVFLTVSFHHFSFFVQWNIWSSSCDFLAVHHIGLPDTIFNVWSCMVKFHTPILPSTPYFSQQLFEMPAQLLCKQGLQALCWCTWCTYEQTLHPVTMHLTLTAVYFSKCIRDSSLHVLMLRFQ